TAGISTAECQDVGELASPCSPTAMPSAAVFASRTARWISVSAPDALTPRLARTEAGGRTTGRRPVLVRWAPVSGGPMVGGAGTAACLSRRDRRVTGTIGAVSEAGGLTAEEPAGGGASLAD